MTEASPLLFTLNLRHLSADGRKAGAGLPPVQLYYVAIDQVQTLLHAIDALAPTLAPPAEPEVRISGPTGEFVVRVKDGRLHLTSWSSAHRGGTTKPADIIAAVTAAESDEPVAGSRQRRGAPARTAKEKFSVIAMAAAILLVNSFTVWVLTKPPRTLAAKCRLLPPEPAERLLAEVAGAYETGRSAGDRRLEIRRDASAQRVKFGAGGAVKDQQTFTVQPAMADGKRVLVTTRRSLITVKDNLSVLLYGDTYTRITN